MELATRAPRMALVARTIGHKHSAEPTLKATSSLPSKPALRGMLQQAHNKALEIEAARKPRVVRRPWTMQG